MSRKGGGDIKLCVMWERRVEKLILFVFNELNSFKELVIGTQRCCKYMLSLHVNVITVTIHLRLAQVLFVLCVSLKSFRIMFTIM